MNNFMMNLYICVTFICTDIMLTNSLVFKNHAKLYILDFGLIIFLERSNI